jgi:hypothetical protein
MHEGAWMKKIKWMKKMNEKKSTHLRMTSPVKVSIGY